MKLDFSMLGKQYHTYLVDEAGFPNIRDHTYLVDEAGFLHVREAVSYLPC